MRIAEPPAAEAVKKRRCQPQMNADHADQKKQILQKPSFILFDLSHPRESVANVLTSCTEQLV